LNAPNCGSLMIAIRATDIAIARAIRVESLNYLGRGVVKINGPSRIPCG
jgi:hypothetical protein